MPDTPRSPILLPLVLLAVLGTLWGISPTVNKMAVLGGLSPLGYGFWQCVIASTGLLGIAVARGRPPPVDRTHIRYYGFTGAIGLAIPAFTMYAALRHVPAGLMAALLATTPLLTYAIALAVRTEVFDLRRGGGLALGLAGALLILLPRSGLPDPEVSLWTAIAILTPTMYAVNAVVAGRFMPDGTDALTLAAGMIVAALLAYGTGLLVAVAGGWLDFVWPWSGSDTALASVLWHGTTSVAAYALYFRIIRLSGAVYLSQVGYVVVMVGLAVGMSTFGERYSLTVWLAILAMLAGITLVNLGQRRVARRA